MVKVAAARLQFKDQAVKLHQKLVGLASVIDSEGGRLYAVGGWVRDNLLGRDSSDVDCEVHGLEPDHLEQILNRYGAVNRVGKSFGVYKWISDSVSADISHAVGEGESVKGHEVDRLQWALNRRDFRCNALLYDPLQGGVIDRVEGRQDIKERRLRAVCPERFGEDSLRGLRGPRFESTLNFVLDEEARGLCAAQDVSELPGERIWGELSRLLLGKAPGRGWVCLQELGLLRQLFADSEGLHDPELGVILDRAQGRLHQEPPASRLAVQLTLLTRSLSESQREEWFQRLKLDHFEGVSLRRVVAALHRWRVDFAGNSGIPSDRALRVLADQCPVRWGLQVWSCLEVEADFDRAWSQAVALKVDRGALPVLLSGQDLIERGLSPGPLVGQLLAEARMHQQDGVFSDRAAALEWLNERIFREKKRPS